MKLFSQRKGYKKVSDVMQIESMSDELRNSIWNVLDVFLWSSEDYILNMYGGTPEIERFSQALWFSYFKKPIDERPESGNEILQNLRNYFFQCKWFEVYDFIEFVVSHHKDNTTLYNSLNTVLEGELSGYRIVDGHVVDITDKQEIKMLEDALKDTKYEGVNAHLRRALELLSDRDNPDYRNSIKESISAVESMAKAITGDTSATLGRALEVLESKKKIHPALKRGFSSLYGYTSDEDGVRHAMLERPNISAADAKYFLLSCTSFVNYLKSQL